MKIAVWGDSGEKKVYECFMALASMVSLITQEKVIAMQGACDMRKIDFGFSGTKSQNVMKEDYAYYNSRGIDQIILRAISSELTTEHMWDNFIHVPKSRLFFLPSSRKCIDELLYDELNCSIDYILKVIDKMKEKVFISADCGRNGISDKILYNADMNVICIGQRNEAIGKELLQDNVIMDKSVFVITDYDVSSKYNIGNIRRKYNLAGERIYGIPHNSCFDNAVCEGKTYDFLRKNLNIRPEHDNYEFISRLKLLATAV